MAFPKKLSDYDGTLKDQRIDYVTAAAKAGVGMQSLLVVSGGGPDTVTLPTKMANTSYVVIVQGETAARVTVDETTKTVSGFDVLNGGAGEVLNIMVVGQLKNQVA